MVGIGVCWLQRVSLGGCVRLDNYKDFVVLTFHIEHLQTFNKQKEYLFHTYSADYRFVPRTATCSLCVVFHDVRFVWLCYNQVRRE